MCRLFEYKTKNPQKTNKLLIEALSDFRSLSTDGCVPCGIKKGHNDGWGIVAYKKNDPYLYYRSILSIKNDKNFYKILDIIRETKPDIVVSHIRKISNGLKIIKNTHPFLLDNFSLAHNGTIFYKNRKKSSKSDSLLFFEDVGSKAFNLKKFISKYKKVSVENDYTSMNMIFSDGINIFAVKNINQKYKQSKKMCFDEYYTLNSFTNKECTFICSEKIQSLKNLKYTPLKDNHFYKY